MEADRSILFADVSNSTGITETLGDVESRRLIGEMLDEMAAITERLGGTVIKTIGDEIMSAFEYPIDCVSAAVDMQRATSARPPMGGVPSAIKIGLDSGPVVLERGDVFGDVVNVAARVIGMAAAEQILTTGRTIGRIEGEVVPHRSLGLHGVRGRDEQLHLVEILWRGETAQMTVVAPKLGARPKPELDIQLGEQLVTVKGDRPKMSIGRGAECDLVVPSAAASRAHADLVCAGGLFYLEDHSTNGTYIKPEGAQEILVHRGQALLQGSGLIRLGEPISVKGPLDIEYRIRYGT